MYNTLYGIIRYYTAQSAKNPITQIHRREATAPSIIRKVRKVQGGKEMPPDGGIVLPENVHMQPFLPKV